MDDEILARLDERMERGFAQVDEAFAEQRQFIEFLYDKLDKKMDAGFARIDARFARMEAGFARIDARLDRLEHTILQVLQFVDVQIKTNELVERRLLLLERANPMRPM